MSNWIESHAALRDHPKLKRFARLVGINRREAIGLLHCLWWWALDYAPDGDLSNFSDEDIADGLDWEGDPQQLVAALVDAGFVDGHQIHDWEEYGGRLHWRRRANAERMKAARAKHSIDTTVAPSEDVQNTCNTRAPHVQEKCRATGQDRTGQDIQDLDPPNGGSSVAAAAPPETHGGEGQGVGGKETKKKSKKKGDFAPDADFDRFWSLYPRKVKVVVARAAWDKAREEADADLIIAGLEKQLPDMRAKMAQEPEYVPHASSWLNQERWRDEVESVSELSFFERVNRTWPG